ncbi:MAG: hypothetical protein HWN68_13690 [Desulfobacterales bacterium]|nr:hypothetical protein [Desulfobacterales bacterium]
MAIVGLEIEADADLISKVDDLALSYFGDASDASKARVLEVAFQMRCLWSRLVEGGEKEVDEPLYRLKESERTPLWNGFWKNI